MTVTAERIVADLASRLADPVQVATLATAPGNVDVVPGHGPLRPWSSGSLGEGHAGVALLFAELARTDPGHRRTAHAHLAAAVSGVERTGGSGLYAGVPALGFAALAAAAGGGYAGLLRTVDDHVRTTVGRITAERRDRPAPGVPMSSYDVIGGMSGIARYLLARGPETADVLTDALGFLVALTEPVEVGGRTVPGWWVPDGPSLIGSDRYQRGHFNLGLAHGAAGPLALLSIAWRAGCRVPGQEAAVGRIADWLTGWRRHDEFGAYWPADVTYEEEVTGRPPAPPHHLSRFAWCYGTAGIARALQLAGTALDRPLWTDAATAAMRAAFDRPEAGWGVEDTSLCHGWAGLLRVARRMADDGAGDDGLADRCGALTERIVHTYRPDAPFGFRYTSSVLAVAPDRAGFLEGASGIALALLGELGADRPGSDWDGALLLA